MRASCAAGFNENINPPLARLRFGKTDRARIDDNTFECHALLFERDRNSLRSLLR